MPLGVQSPGCAALGLELGDALHVGVGPGPVIGEPLEPPASPGGPSNDQSAGLGSGDNFRGPVEFGHG